jgi:hypothetical protein
LVLKKKGIGKKKKKNGSGKLGNWTKKPKKKSLPEKAIIIPVPFTVEVPDEHDIIVESPPELKT